MSNLGQVAETPLYLYAGARQLFTATIVGRNLTANTISLKVWQFPGAALDIDDECVSSLSGGNTVLTSVLTGTQTDVGYSRGYYSIHDETLDEILLHGPVIVSQVPT